MAFHSFTSTDGAYELSFANETVPIFFGRGRDVGNKRFDQISARPFEGLSAAEIRGIRFDKRGVETVLADQKAELIAETRLAIVRTV